jgi:hypothetical protein
MNDQFWARYPLDEEPKSIQKTWRGREVVPTKEILRLLRETELSCKEIAAICGFTESNLTQRLKAHINMTPTAYRKKCGWMGGQRGLSPRAARQMVVLRQSGATKGQISATIHSSPEIIRDVLGPGRMFPQGYNLPEATIARRYKEGENTVELARVYRVNEKTIRRVLDDQGVPRRGHQSRAGRATWGKA